MQGTRLRWRAAKDGLGHLMRLELEEKVTCGYQSFIALFYIKRGCTVRLCQHAFVCFLLRAGESPRRWGVRGTA